MFREMWPENPKNKSHPKLIYTPLIQDVVIFFKDNMSFDFGLLDFIKVKYWATFEILLFIIK